MHKTSEWIDEIDMQKQIAVTQQAETHKNEVIVWKNNVEKNF